MTHTPKVSTRINVGTSDSSYISEIATFYLRRRPSVDLIALCHAIDGVKEVRAERGPKTLTLITDQRSTNGTAHSAAEREMSNSIIAGLIATVQAFVGYQFEEVRDTFRGFALLTIDSDVMLDGNRPKPRWYWHLGWLVPWKLNYMWWRFRSWSSTNSPWRRRGRRY